MMIADTVLLGHYGSEDLAAAAVGGGIFIAVLLALAGVLQALAPIVAQLRGAGRDAEIGETLRQGLWLALLLTVPGVGILLFPDPLLGLADLEPGVEQKARLYLAMLAAGVPAYLLYRAFYAFCNALGRPRPLLVISLAGTALHVGLASLLVFRVGGGLGVLGCALSATLVDWLALGAAFAYLRNSRELQSLALLTGWGPPRPAMLGEILRLGMPLGASYLVEVSAFTLMALFIAELGAETVSGHRIVTNLYAVCYMFPLALGTATLTQVGHAVGAGDNRRARQAALCGVALGAVVSGLLAAALWLGGDRLLALYTGEAGVLAVAESLLGYVVVYLVFDAVQTLAAFALRGYRITFVPMCIHTTAFWAVGLFGGWWLCFRNTPPLGAAGFWLAAVASVVLAVVLLGGLLWRAVRAN